MRAFRDRYFHRYERLDEWWDLAARNTASLAYLTMRDSGMRKAAGALFRDIPEVLENLDAPLPQDFLEHARRAVSLARKSNMRRLRLDASRVEAVLQQLKPRSTGFAGLSASRYPTKKKRTRRAK